MNRLDFDCPFDLADTITALLGDIDDDYPVISVYGKYDVIKELLEDLIASGVSIANEIELQDYDVAHYDKEFVLYLTKNGVNVEKTFDVYDVTYLYGGGDISFVHEDCNSKLLNYVDSKTIYEFGYDEIDDEDECDCDRCEYSDNDEDDGYTINGKPATKEEFNEYVSQFRKTDEKQTTTSSTKSVYKVNGKEVSKEEYEKVLDKFSDKYMDSVQDILLNHLEFIDEMRNFAKLFNW